MKSIIVAYKYAKFIPLLIMRNLLVVRGEMKLIGLISSAKPMSRVITSDIVRHGLCIAVSKHEKQC